MTLATGIDALKTMYGQENAKKIFNTYIAGNLEKLDLFHPDAKLPKEIKGLFQDAIKSYEKRRLSANEQVENEHNKNSSQSIKKLAQLEIEMDKARGRRLPTVLARDFTVNGKEYSEKSENTSTIASANYLACIDEKNDEKEYEKQINYIRDCNSQDGTSRRLSPLKDPEEVQGNLINAIGQSVYEGGKLIGHVARSGIPATHGRGKPGLEALKKAKGLLEEGKTREAEKLSGGRTLQELEREIETRTHLVTAQFLPKIATEIKDQIAKNPEAFENSIKFGEFLLVEQTFVSDQNASEKAMLEDASGALSHINENIKVLLSNDKGKDGQVTKELNPDGTETGKFIMTVYVPLQDHELPKELLRTNQILTAQGVIHN